MKLVLCILLILISVSSVLLASSESDDYEGQVPVEEPLIIPQHRTPMGDNPCTYGPSYFCKSVEIMKKCKMEKYCHNL